MKKKFIVIYGPHHNFDDYDKARQEADRLALADKTYASFIYELKSVVVASTTVQPVEVTPK